MISGVKVRVMQTIACDYCVNTVVLSDVTWDVGERLPAVQLPERWRMIVQSPYDGMRTHIVCPDHQTVVRDWKSENQYVERSTFPGGFNNLKEMTNTIPGCDAWRGRDVEDPFDFA